VRAGEAIIALTQDARPPRHLVLGEFGYNAVTERLRARLKEIEGQKARSLGADFPKG
jgi:hypothetical protein